jgi:hypothetical protein
MFVGHAAVPRLRPSSPRAWVAVRNSRLAASMSIATAAASAALRM